MDNVELEPLTQDSDTVQISFAGCGGMYHYYLGIAKVLQDNFELDNVIFGGTSGGCFPGLLLLLGHDIDHVHYTLNRAILDETNQYWFGSLFRYNNIVRKHMTDFLHEDDYKKLEGKLHISVTNLASWGNEIVSSWESTEDLIHCIQCSCFIPMLFEAKLWYWHRGTRYIDGGITNNMVKTVVNRPHIDITCYKWRNVNYNWIWCYSCCLWAEQLYKWGKEDAMKNIDEFAEHLKWKKYPNLMSSIVYLPDDDDDKDNLVV